MLMQLIFNHLISHNFYHHVIDPKIVVGFVVARSIRCLSWTWRCQLYIFIIIKCKFYAFCIVLFSYYIRVFYRSVSLKRNQHVLAWFLRKLESIMYYDNMFDILMETDCLFQMHELQFRSQRLNFPFQSLIFGIIIYILN